MRLNLPLANNKLKAAPAVDMLSSKGLGQLRSVESVLFQLEESADPRARQTLFVRKLDEALRLSLRLFSYEKFCIILDPLYFIKKVEATSFGSSMSQKERKTFLSDCRNMSTLTIPRLTFILNYLRDKGVLESVIGTEISLQRIHYIKDSNHFRHALGLSDAVDLSMTNTGVTVRFPSRIQRKVTVSDPLPWGKRAFARPGKSFFYSMRRLTTKHRRFHLLLHYLRVIPSGLEEKDYVKLIKTTLAGTFSEKMEQDQPIGDRFPLFPDHTQKKLDSLLRKKEDRVQFYFNLLQSKALCAEVGRDMIDDAYVKHQKSLCRPVEQCLKVPDDHLKGLYEYGRKVGKWVQNHYEPNKTTLPNTRASVEKGRHLGGNLIQLKEAESIRCYSNHPIYNISEGVQRMEPYVIGLFGSPGSGKTTLTQSLIRQLGKLFFPDLKSNDLAYARSCNTDHWDGYTNQPIVVLDDFGQDHKSRADIVEFENLVSVNQYILPMADLADKGKLFTSPIIILTSNCQFGSNLVSNNATFIEEPWAVWRRISLPLLIQPGKILQYEYEVPAAQQVMWDKKYFTWQTHYTMSVPYCKANRPSSSMDLRVKTLEGVNNPYDLGQLIARDFDKKFRFHNQNINSKWTQTIQSRRIITNKSDRPLEWDVYTSNVDIPNSDKDWTLEMEFDSEPPSGRPTVKAIALSEPLKVRMITAAEASTKVLQPFQQALWSYLAEQPQFCLTNGVKAPWSEHDSFLDDTIPWIYRIEHMIQEIQQRFPDGNWLSGDYTAATDNFPMEVTSALIEGILSEIDHEPTKNWVRWECSSHDILYPRGIKGVQTSGQLMGSLLSFPLLCFLNDFIVSKAGFEKFSYLINGDDVVAKGPDETIQNWRQMSPEVGLSLSLGKNFIDPDFCTVNSQLFYRGNVLHTGKVSCQTRVGTSLGYCFEEAQFYWGPDDWVKYEFLKRNLLELKKTPRSLHVSKQRGGLALYDSFELTGIRYDPGLLKEVYLFDLLRKFDKLISIPGTTICAVPTPVLRGSKAREYELPGKNTVNQLMSFDHKVKIEDNCPTDLTNVQLRRFREKIEKYYPKETKDHIQQLLKNGKYQLQDFPNLDFLEIDYIFVTKGQGPFILERSRQACLDFLSLTISQTTDPYEWSGGEAIELSKVNQRWSDLKEIFIDCNLLTVDETVKVCDLDITEDVARWFNDLDSKEYAKMEELNPPNSLSYPDRMFLKHQELLSTITENIKSELPM